MILTSKSPDGTLDIGRRLARVLRAGDVVLLSGRLGSGKTLFVSGIAEGLGVQEQVTSPSFVIVHEYDGFLKIIHADMYRLGSVGEFDRSRAHGRGSRWCPGHRMGRCHRISDPGSSTHRDPDHRRIDPAGCGSCPWDHGGESLEELAE